MNRNHLVSLVQKYLGIPYRHAGRDTTGLDCLGLVYSFYRDCGIAIPDNDGGAYAPDWYKTDPERFLRGITKIGGEIPLIDLQPLDFVYFRMGKNITHCGIMVSPTRFLHVIENTAVHISLLNFSWKRRLAGARRLIGPRSETTVQS